MKKTLIIFFTIFLVACAKTPKLQTPQNLNFVNNTLKFDSVENATSYVLEIKKDSSKSFLEEVFETEILFSNVGSYTVKVKAKAQGFKDSNFSKEISFDVINSVNPILELTNNVLHWMPIVGAIKYIIDTNRNQIETTNTYYLLESIGTYKVKAVFLNGESGFSNSKEVTSLENPKTDLRLNYVINTGFTFTLLPYYDSKFIFFLDKEQINDNGAYFYNKDKGFTFNELFLNSLLVGEHEFTLITMNHHITITVNVDIHDKPYMVSHSQIPFSTTTDYKLFFNLRGGELILSNIDEEYYTFEKGILTLDHNAINGMFKENQENLIISFSLRKDDNYIISIFTIKK